MIAAWILVTLLAGCSGDGPLLDPPDGTESPDGSDAPDHGEGPVATVAPGTALHTPFCEGSWSVVDDREVFAVPALAEPEPRVPFRDPVFGTCLVRVTDRDADLGVFDAGDPSPGLKNEYSRVQSFNADGSRIVVRSIEQEWYLYDAASLSPVAHLAIASEPRWDPVDPDVLYYPDESSLVAYDVVSGDAAVLHDFQQYFGTPVTVSTRDEGRPSMDGRFFGLLAQDEEWEPVGFIVYDKESDTATVRDLGGMAGVDEGIDFVTISPLGTTFLAGFDRFCEEGRSGSDADPCGLMAYDRDLRNGRSIIAFSPHHDVALDADGREVVIYQDVRTDHVALVDVATGGAVDLFPIDFTYSPVGLHFSGVGYDRPGWAVMSTYAGAQPESATWLDDQVFLVELRPGGRVLRLAHTHSVWNVDEEHDYWAEPHASGNRDLTRILFTTNWGRSGTEEVDMFMIELPDDWE